MSGPHVLIVEARFYDDLADDLAAGAEAALAAGGATHERVAVPGSFELPAAIRFLVAARRADSSRRGFDGAVALGCVIKGETDHYEHICREVSRGLMDVGLLCDLPLGFGLLTCLTYGQARERADPARMNKGADAARACLRLIELRAASSPGRP